MQINDARLKLVGSEKYKIRLWVGVYSLVFEIRKENVFLLRRLVFVRNTKFCAT